MKRLRKLLVLVVTVSIVLAGIAIVGAEEGGKVNINTAVKEKLIELDGIGPKYADRIIEYREKVAPFKTPEDIMKVKGIGKKIYEANKDRITVE
jgi:competence protein ComEA